MWTLEDRLRKARDEGQAARSRDLSHFVVVAVDFANAERMQALARLYGEDRALTLRRWLGAYLGCEPTKEAVAAFHEKRRPRFAELRRLESGEPLPYVLGRWEFFGMEFEWH